MLLGSGLLLIVPIVVLILGWQWQPSAHPLGGESTFLWIANSAAKPWGALTILFCLVLLFFFILKLPKKHLFSWQLLVVATLVLGQLIKVVVKIALKEPRPYVVWVSNQLSISPEHFYQVSRPEREQLLHNGLSHSSLIPQWQFKPLASRKPGYAFSFWTQFILRNTSFICVCAVYVTTPLFLASLRDIMGY